MKAQRLEWLARVFSSDPEALADEAANEHLFDRMNDFGMEHFVTTYRPLVKLREARGPLEFHVANVVHEAPDLTHIDLCLGEEVIFNVRVRFADAEPHRIRYWSPHKPLPPGVALRPYVPSDAAGCTALEMNCPMEGAEGVRWTVDRGDAFDDYLQLVAPYDAWVAEHDGTIIAFLSCSLRPIRINNEAAFAVYQHHYRVHPEFRKGSVSQALASAVDARRTFDGLPVVMPYSLIDPDNPRMQHMGFPEVPEVRIARLTVPMTVAAPAPLQQPSVEVVQALSASTHGDRALFPDPDPDGWADRLTRIGTYGLAHFRAHGAAMLGVWNPLERNLVEQDGRVTESRLSFGLDYGFDNLADFEVLIRAYCAELAGSGATHLALMCDVRAPEYGLLAQLADNEQQFAVHTLPWMVEAHQEKTLYVDAAYT